MALNPTSAAATPSFASLQIACQLTESIAVAASEAIRVDDGLPRVYSLDRGCCYFQLEGHTAPLRMAAGELTILAQGTAHELVVPTVEETGIDEAIISTATFRALGDEATPALDQVPQLIVLPLPSARTDQALPDDSSRFHGARLLSEPSRLPILQRLIEVALIDAIGGPGDATDESPAMASGTLTDASILRAKRILAQRFNEPWTVALLARAVDMSRSVLAARFTEMVGVPPMQYVSECRMHHAAQLLAEGDLLIKQIARRVGFGSASTFSTAFKRWSGKSPAEYRHADVDGVSCEV